MTKSIQYFNSSALTTSGNITAGTGYVGQSAEDEAIRMDVVVVVNTFSGTSPTLGLKVQEQISGTSGGDNWVTTAGTASNITGPGTYVFCNEGQSGQTGVSNSFYGFAMLGKGKGKRIVTTFGGTVGAFQADIYLVFYN